MFEYFYPLLRANAGLLLAQLRAAGLPAANVFEPEGGVRIVTTRELTEPELFTLEDVVEAHTPRRPRALLAVSQDVFALPANDRLKVFSAVAAVVLNDHPQLARLLGVPFDADEPDPG